MKAVSCRKLVNRPLDLDEHAIPDRGGDLAQNDDVRPFASIDVFQHVVDQPQTDGGALETVAATLENIIRLFRSPDRIKGRVDLPSEVDVMLWEVVHRVGLFRLRLREGCR